MVDEKPPADFSTGVYFYPRQKTCFVRSQTTQKTKLMLPEEMGNTITPEGVQTGITKQNLKDIPRRRVTVENRPDVLS
jgi:hypothetical protein